MTGGMPISHCGPICSSAEYVARLLTAIAGPDGYDPRTVIAKEQDYMGALSTGVKIALMKEGFRHPTSDQATDEKAGVF